MSLMRLKAMLLILAVTCVLVQAPGRDPLRAGVDVPEPKLIEKAEITYPEGAKLADCAGPVVLSISIDEQGRVDEVKKIIYHPMLIESAISAVKQWRFSPTFVKGKAVPVTATVVVLFSLRFTPNAVRLGDVGQWVMSYSGPIMTPVIMNKAGIFREAYDLGIKNEPEQYFGIVPESQVPFSVIEAKLKSDLIHFDLWDPQYRFPGFYVENARPGLNRLYYSVLLTSTRSKLIQLAGVDPNVQPPKFDIDFTRLSEAPSSTIRTRTGDFAFHTVFVDEHGSILGTERRYKLDEEQEIINALNSVHVTEPGMRNGVPVPTAVIVAISVQ